MYITLSAVHMHMYVLKHRFDNISSKISSWLRFNIRFMKLKNDELFKYNLATFCRSAL